MPTIESSSEPSATKSLAAPSPRRPPVDMRPLGMCAIALSIVASVVVMTKSYERIKNRPVERQIQITGSAKRAIRSDLAEWSGTISTQNLDRTVAYRQLHTQLETARAYLKTQGFADTELSTSAASFEELSQTEVVGSGDARIEKTVFQGFHTQAAITIKSADVEKVERVAREITQLLDQGITVTSSDPSYFYTKLGELKIEMLAEASKDARTRAEKMLGSAGGAALGPLISANMGVINVNPANSTSTTWDGNNDTSALDKDIITIVRASYALR